MSSEEGTFYSLLLLRVPFPLSSCHNQGWDASFTCIPSIETASFVLYLIHHHMLEIKKLKEAHGVEPWTYRTAADCSTTELYLRVVRKCVGLRVFPMTILEQCTVQYQNKRPIFLWNLVRQTEICASLTTLSTIFTLVRPSPSYL